MEYKSTKITPQIKSRQQNIISIFFMVIIILAFVGTEPFASSFRGDLRTTNNMEGSSIRQILLLLSFSYLLLSIRGNFHAKLRILSLLHFTWFGWIFLTLMWSPDFFLSSKKLILTFLTFSLAFLFYFHLGTEKMLKILAATLAALCIASLFSGFITSAAIHQPGETAGLVGSWRGIFPHKNNAGFAAAIGIFLSLFQFKSSRNKYWLALILVEISFIYLTDSKTSIYLLIFISIFYFILNWSIRSNNANIILGILFAQIFTCALVLALFMHSEVYDFFGDPTNLTSRVFVWNLIVNAWSERPFTGVGFGSLWLVDSRNNLLTPLLSGQYLAINQGHNGFLDIAATTGAIGIILSILVIFGLAVIRLLKNINNKSITPYPATILSLLLFMFLHNLSESSLLRDFQSTWFILSIVHFMAIGIPFDKTNLERRSASQSVDIIGKSKL